MLCFKNIIMIFILLSEFFVDKHKRKQKGIFAQNWQGLKMCYVRCKWSREVESCKKQTTVYRRRVRHSHFNFSQMMMMMMILGQMSFIPPHPPHPTPTSIFAHLENFFCPHEGYSTLKKFLQNVRNVNSRIDQHHLNVDMINISLML